MGPAEGVHRREQETIGKFLRVRAGARGAAVEQRQETVVLDNRPGLAAGDLDQRRQKVRLLNRQRHATGLGLPRPVDQEGDVQHLAVSPVTFAFAEKPAVA